MTEAGCEVAALMAVAADAACAAPAGIAGMVRQADMTATTTAIRRRRSPRLTCGRTHCPPGTSVKVQRTALVVRRVPAREGVGRLPNSRPTREWPPSLLGLAGTSCHRLLGLPCESQRAAAPPRRLSWLTRVGRDCGSRASRGTSQRLSPSWWSRRRERLAAEEGQDRRRPVDVGDRNCRMSRSRTTTSAHLPARESLSVLLSGASW